MVLCYNRNQKEILGKLQRSQGPILRPGGGLIRESSELWLRKPKYHLIDPIRPLMEVHWGGLGVYALYLDL